MDSESVRGRGRPCVPSPSSPLSLCVARRVHGMNFRVRGFKDDGDGLHGRSGLDVRRSMPSTPSMVFISVSTAAEKSGAGMTGSAKRECARGGGVLLPHAPRPTPRSSEAVADTSAFDASMRSAACTSAEPCGIEARSARHGEPNWWKLNPTPGLKGPRVRSRRRWPTQAHTSPYSGPVVPTP